MSLTLEQVEAQIAQAFEPQPPKLKVSGGLLDNEHTDKIDGAHIDVVFNEQRETPDT